MKRRKRVSRNRKVARLEASGNGETSFHGETPGSGRNRWEEFGRGRKSPKKRVTLYLDADVLSWCREQGPRYQSEMNRVLREVMMKEKQPRALRFEP